MNEARPYHFKTLTARYLRLRVAECFGAGVAIALVSYSILYLCAVPKLFLITLTIVVGLTAALTLALIFGLNKFDDRKLSRFLNQNYKDLESSSDLLLLPDSGLTSLQQLQKARTFATLTRIEEAVIFPHRLKETGIALFTGLVIFMLSGFFAPGGWKKQWATTRQNSTTDTVHDVALTNLQIKISPPSYTGQTSFVSNDRSIRAPEGSMVEWTPAFSGAVQNPNIILSGKDTLALRNLSQNNVAAKKILTSSGFYQIIWTEHNKTKNTDYYPIDIARDMPPRAVIEMPGQFTELTFRKNVSVNIQSTISDDYGVKEAFIIATVSKGSGESVKFREEKINFTSPTTIGGKLIHAGCDINLDLLGMEPGDELYFYISTTDNRFPHPNISRTETFFVSLTDTAALATSLGDGMGVDLMPQYFRSQRQIIIDTEKLLDEQKKHKVPASDFNRRSNDLAYDQKVLRLRYGQFLGEEFENGTPAAGEAEHTDHESESSPAKEQDAGGKENALHGYTHEHDTGEANSLFEESLKTKLKIALNLMWDAELHLRLNHPALSLPFQYKILRLLKEISNDSRVYVRRTGFDPPPVKEDKRLKGDLSEIKNSAVRAKENPNGDLAIQNGLQVIESILEKNNSGLSASQSELLIHAANELSGLALQDPGQYLHALSLLRTLINGEFQPSSWKKNTLEIRSALWRSIPEISSSPSRRSATIHALDEQFIKNLERSAHE